MLGEEAWGAQSDFQFVPKVFRGVEIGVLPHQPQQAMAPFTPGIMNASPLVQRLVL